MAGAIPPQGDAALLTDGQDRADEMLVVSHAAGDAVHDYPETVRGHSRRPSLTALPI